MPDAIPDTSHPGKELFELLKHILPPTADFPKRVDELLQADGTFVQLLYESTLLYVLRRLIRTAQFIDRYNRTDRELYSHLRQQLRDEYSLNDKVELVLSLLVLAVQCGRDDVTGGERASIEETTLRAGSFRCYLCGRDFIQNSQTHEHHWPRTLGGVSRPENVRLACNECNNLKGEIVPESDVHYEHLTIKTVPGDVSFLTEFNKYFRLAVQLKSKSKCAICSMTVSRYGPMRAGRLDTSQPWHYLNVVLFCDRHYPDGEEA